MDCPQHPKKELLYCITPVRFTSTTTRGTSITTLEFIHTSATRAIHSQYHQRDIHYHTLESVPTNTNRAKSFPMPPEGHILLNTRNSTDLRLQSTLKYRHQRHYKHILFSTRINTDTYHKTNFVTKSRNEL